MFFRKVSESNEWRRVVEEWEAHLSQGSPCRASGKGLGKKMIHVYASPEYPQPRAQTQPEPAPGQLLLIDHHWLERENALLSIPELEPQWKRWGGFHWTLYGKHSCSPNRKGQNLTFGQPWWNPTGKVLHGCKMTKSLLTIWNGGLGFFQFMQTSYSLPVPLFCPWVGQVTAPWIPYVWVGERNLPDA